MSIDYHFENVFVKRVIDGDTIVITLADIHPLFGLSLPIRVAGVQAPELKTPDKKPNPLGIKAKQFTERFIRQKGFVDLKNCKRGRYFRIVADVFIDGVSLGSELLNSGNAVKW